MVETDQQFLEYVVKAMVSKPEKVTVTRSMDAMGVLLKLTVDAEDMGKVIGRDGKTAVAIRLLLKIVGKKNQANVSFKVLEPDGGEVSKKFDSRSIDEAIDDLKI
ncbi:MAG: KH domain-containing protein [Candidatus Paceibacterota bacterium]